MGLPLFAVTKGNSCSTNRSYRNLMGRIPLQVETSGSWISGIIEKNWLQTVKNCWLKIVTNWPTEVKACA